MKKQTPNEKNKNSERKLHEMEASNLADREFRVMIIRMLNNMKKDIETIKKDLSEIDNETSEINNTLEGINSRLDEAEDQSSDLKDKVQKNTKKSSTKKKN